VIRGNIERIFLLFFNQIFNQGLVEKMWCHDYFLIMNFRGVSTC